MLLIFFELAKGHSASTVLALSSIGLAACGDVSTAAGLAVASGLASAVVVWSRIRRNMQKQNRRS